MQELYLAHHGVKGQKYGVRRWQYKDGSLTPEGYIHYGYGKNKSRTERNAISKMHSRSNSGNGSSTKEGRSRYGVGEYIKNRNDIRKARSEGYKRARSDFQRELSDIDKNLKGTAQNKPVIQAAKKYDKARKSVSQEYKSAVKEEKEKFYNLTDEQKRNLKVALGVTAAVAVTAGAIYYSKNKSFYSSELMSKKLSEDFVLSKGSKIQNLSFDADRMRTARLWRSNGDMMYASHTPRDNVKYMAYYATNPKAILEGKVPPLKYKLTGSMAANVKVASEKSGAAVFSELFRNNDSFRDFVTDPSKMREYYVSRVPKQFSGYKEALKALDRVSRSSNPSENDLRLVYRLFNYTIPHEESVKVRGMFFSELKRAGYGALLDTNDALYGGFHSYSPVIIFDMEKVISDSATKLKYSDIVESAIKNAKNSASLVDASRTIYR